MVVNGTVRSGIVEFLENSFRLDVSSKINSRRRILVDVVVLSERFV